ncbi:hypothetical protein ASC77_09435 [Nocardioides sp. Root1257]|uniref:phage tail protein n=1 Tax=unclassified Nocardioides TaxID=2615069 RepID=UPI0006FEF38F|nr:MULTISPECIES: phage tail protein [unclassified Nocardioides]KQW48931.1 hypothetical protein ASC77_09435 [Nocardioides sp. Root1257]KRC48106.1 hypothetical protein ASE24_09440 [Nocardioides sp. Root224]
MDVQGSQFHLLDGRPDWARCDDVASGLTLGELWEDGADGVPSSVPTGWEYDDAGRVLRLRRDTPLFRRAGRTEPLDPDARRGAGRDGHWYWIDAGRTAIRRLVAGRREAEPWWSTGDLLAACTCADGAPGTFSGGCTCPPSDLRLSGLTVTGHHYLLAGYTAPGEAGLLVFDLLAGGTPLRMLWPDTFRPWDLVDLDDGGALVLDRAASAYWRLDEHLRLRGVRPSRLPAFTSVDDADDPLLVAGPVDPSPMVLRDEDGELVHPISVEPGPDGCVLVLDADPVAGASTVYCFDGDVLRWQTSLADIVEVVDPEDPTATGFLHSILGHDLAYLAEGGPLDAPLLYVADSAGDQVVAFVVDLATGDLVARDEFLPLRRWAARALVRSGGELWYDFGERWVTVQVFAERRYAATATLTTPVGFGTLPGLGSDTFDSGRPGCTWHRLLLDAHVPTGTSITVRARACDDPTLLTLEPWLAQPTPYLRSESELPWADPWADRRGDPRAPVPLPDGMGTHELLLQQVAGRYVQLEVTLTGGGRATPLLRSLRAWYPRFSYVEHYLPAFYAENDGPGRFLERFLANPEGTLTAIEERIEHTHLLLDPRTALAGDLPWLAAWFGLALDPQWDEQRRRFLVGHVDRFYRIRGTVAGVVAILRAYLETDLDERVFRSALAGAGGIRVVERFLTRDTGGAAYGAPETLPDPDPETRVRDAAHRFDVLVPATLTADQLAMVDRIVAAARPAHTAFALRTYDELFVVGQARLGLDTELGRAPLFEAVVPGRTRLAAGYLGYAHPFDIADRVVSDRDRIGGLPAL